MSRISIGVLTLLVCILPMIAGFLRVWVYQDVIQFGYHLSSVEKKRQTLVAQLEQLEVELATAKSPERLSSMAKELGMVQPTATAIAGISSLKGGVHAKK